jgi:hypothetical protein
VTVVEAALDDPVIVSVGVKSPVGTVTVKVVDVALVIIDAVEALVPPVIVSPTVKLAVAATVNVIVPMG